jgi:alpha-L-fucosidase
VLREYCVRYGDKVKGWWIDGCYADDYNSPNFGYDDDKLKIYKDAIRDGNKNAIVAFNNGTHVPVSYYSVHDDFLAGEMNDFVDIPDSRFINGKQWHILAPLGVSPDGNEWHAWCKPGVKRSGEYIRDYVRKVNEKGGVVTIDVCLKRDGSIPIEQIEVLKEINNECYEE